MKPIMHTFAVVVFAMVMLAGTGCSRDRITASSVRRNMSPELASMAHQSQQRKNMHARTIDTDTRQIWDDLDSVLLLNRPSRMSIYPVP